MDGQKERTIRNITEDVVDIYLDDCIKKAGVCGCPRCRADILALALNSLPPHYAATNTGPVYVRLGAMSPQSQADILTAIMNAIHVVEGKPHHEKQG